MRRESILISSNFSNRTGFAWAAFFRLFNHIARRMDQRGLGVVLSFAEIEGDVDVIDADIPRDVVQFDPLHLTPAQLVRLARYIRRHRIRYAYLTDLPSWHWLYGWMRLFGVRHIVVHSHISVASPYPPRRVTGLRRVLKAWLHRARLTAPDRIIACSEFVKARLVDKGCCSPERIDVLHYGLPPHRFRDPAVPHIDGGPVRVFAASRAIQVKGIGILVEAAAMLRDRADLPNFVIEFAGDGPDLEAFRARASQLGLNEEFRFLGYVPDTSSRLGAADIVAIPSNWGDAFPYAVLEAMAAGKAIVASAAGGIPEQLGQPPAGVLVAPGDAEALAAALDRLIRQPDLRETLGRQAHERARANFEEERYVGDVLSYLEDAFHLPLGASTAGAPTLVGSSPAGSPGGESA